MRLRPLFKKAAICAAAALASSMTLAADFPDRPINLVVGYKAGGGVDTYARALSKVASKHLDGEPIVVVNKPGGGGLIGGRFVADQPPTGYSLYLSSAGSMVLRNLAKRQVVSSQDFRMVATVGELTAGVFVPASSPIKTLPELLEKLKQSDKKLRWGHTSRGNVWHIAGVGLLEKNQLRAKDIPFKGGAGVRSALISGQIDFGIIGAHLGRGFEQDIRLLAVLSEKRHPAVPETVTAKELGVAFTEVTSPIVLMAPKRVNDATAQQLSEKFVAMANDTEYLKVMEAAGLPTAKLDAQASSDLIQNAKVEWKSLVGAGK
ncbi:tripartite tricarboxylate transporter substrate binding protein [Motiliproteus coralliicola]|uniref:Tripartite tricarboxylate transporter substrate binding protein n=1 Tax=Motiliproteus coralliicola TaxID=2283196 RepID=A0A369WRA9_9GAMM|nr:tripartite tricarboxylate transporter substrate binding protein [Motiliproteus coralliicola]RDE24648.1 tripartite tricarboxylate transporter substrate binding protein [Motiliproteus coralliicola]